jgi:hypothetical protein
MAIVAALIESGKAKIETIQASRSRGVSGIITAYARPNQKSGFGLILELLKFQQLQ